MHVIAAIDLFITVSLKHLIILRESLNLRYSLTARKVVGTGDTHRRSDNDSLYGSVFEIFGRLRFPEALQIIWILRLMDVAQNCWLIVFFDVRLIILIPKLNFIVLSISPSMFRLNRLFVVAWVVITLDCVVFAISFTKFNSAFLAVHRSKFLDRQSVDAAILVGTPFLLATLTVPNLLHQL